MRWGVTFLGGHKIRESHKFSDSLSRPTVVRPKSNLFESIAVAVVFFCESLTHDNFGHNSSFSKSQASLSLNTYTMRTCNVLSISCAAALVTGTASFTGGFAGTPATRSATTPPLAIQTSCKKRRAGSSLHMSSIPGSRLFSLGDNRRFDEELLQSRHSASDWLYNVFTLPRSSVLRDIRNPVVTIALWGALVSILQRIMAGSSSKVVSKFASDICIGSAPHSFLVSSLGLLLVFRTNSAYQRFNVSACKGKCIASFVSCVTL